MADGPSAAIGDALAELGAELEQAARAAEQLEFLPASNLLPEGGNRVRASVAAARRGRPPGAQNLATRHVKDFCRRVFGIDPMVEGFRWAQHTPESLALVLGCSKLEAFDRLEAIRKDLMRYFYAPMVAVDEDGRPVPVFQMTIGGASSAGSGDAPPWKYLEQLQPVNDPAKPVSHGVVSHGVAK